jgi:phage recombination protein Bet
VSEIIPVGQEKLLADTIMPGASLPELKFFAEVCNRMGLDPFRREIHAVKRRVQEGGSWVERYVFQTGIDGYRKRAAATGAYAGSDVITEPADAPIPAIARATVWRMLSGQRVAFTASARWSEYVQTSREGKPTAMWAKMPHTMLEKVAEAKALRRAFPDELSGLYAEEEMQQASNPPSAPATPAPVDLVATVNAATPEPQPAPAKAPAAANRSEAEDIINRCMEEDGISESALNAWVESQTKGAVDRWQDLPDKHLCALAGDAKWSQFTSTLPAA